MFHLLNAQEEHYIHFHQPLRLLDQMPIECYVSSCWQSPKSTQKKLKSGDHNLQ